MKALLIAVLVVIVVFALFLVVQARSSSQQSPPSVEAGKLPACGSKPNCVSSAAATDSEHYVAPISHPGATLQSIAKAIEALGGVIHSTDENVISATFTSTVFGFVDDVIVVPAPTDGDFQIRSSSRVGYSDMGANRKRVEQLRTAIGKS